MSVIVRIKGASFKAANRGFYPDVIDGLKLWSFFGGSLAESARNLVRNGSSLAITGGTFGANSANGFSANTSLMLAADTPAFTMLTIKSAGVGNNDAVGSSFGDILQTGPVRVGVQLIELLAGATSHRHYDAVGYYDGGSGSDGNFISNSLDTAPQGASPRLVLASYDPATLKTKLRVRNATLDTTLESSAIPGGNQRDLRNTTPFIISSAVVGGDVITATEIYMVAFYSRVLSLSEQNSLYAFIKSYYDRRGVAGL